MMFELMRCSVAKDFIFLDLYCYEYNINYEVKLCTRSKRCNSYTDVTTAIKQLIHCKDNLVNWFKILDDINVLFYRG